MKKFLSIILAAAMLLSVTAGLNLTAGAATLTYGDLTYEVQDDGTIAITGCNKSATSIDIPAEIDGKAVTSIYGGAFQYCTNLTSITVDENNTAYSSVDGVLFNKNKTKLIRYPSGNIRTSYSIPNGITMIGDQAFSFCNALKELNIPDSVMMLGYEAFHCMKSLTNITVSANNKVYSSVDGVLFNIDKTKLIQYPIGNERTSYQVPSTVITIEGCAFHGGKYLVSVMLNISITTISYSAFQGCTSLTNITIPNSVTSIGDFAFNDCISLTSITIPDSVTSIAEYAFYNTAYYNNEANWENYVLYIGNHLIGAKAEISGHYEIKDGAITIAGCAFYSCKSLSSITIPDSVTSIGYRAFLNCESLTSITIPNSVTSIGQYAFYNCQSLTSITIPDSVTSIGHDAFYNTAYYNDESNWENNVLYIGNHLIKAKEEISGAYAVKNGTITIADYAFCSCESLSSITIPDSVTNIGDDVFLACYSLTSITIPNSVTSIGYWTFGNCTNLTSVAIPNSVTWIGNYAFKNCASLTDVYYSGTKDEWNTIGIGIYNENLTSATIHFTGVTEPDTNEPDNPTPSPTPTPKPTPTPAPAPTTSTTTTTAQSQQTPATSTTPITPTTSTQATTESTTTATVKKPKSTSIKSLKKGKKQIKATWKKVSGVKGYQVQVATDKKFKKNKKTVTIKKQKTTSTTIKKLKSNKKYYVRVRTYKTVNGKKVYSSWSKVKTVKTK